MANFLQINRFPGDKMKKLVLLWAFLPALVWARDPFLSNEFKNLLTAAHNNDSQMQYEVGKRYYTGEGVGTDKLQGIEWLTKAASQGHVIAQKALGILYLDGDGPSVPADVAASIQWLERAASQNDLDSQTLLARFYKDGQIVTQDYAKAAQWAELAALQGSAAARYYLGNIYHFGQGREVNLNRAFELYKQSADQGYLDAFNNAGGMLFAGLGTQKDLVAGYAYWIVGKALGSESASKNMENEDKKNSLTDAQKAQANKMAQEMLRKLGIGNQNSTPAPKANTNSNKSNAKSTNTSKSNTRSSSNKTNNKSNNSKK
ncbi:hypothetical protein A4G20_03340 [Pasteurellaceae bacterium RH1A]|nr:hypothetical protein A4G20_03340 [Pasteurellaceae bacterium RH1A]